MKGEAGKIAHRENRSKMLFRGQFYVLGANWGTFNAVLAYLKVDFAF